MIVVTLDGNRAIEFADISVLPWVKSGSGGRVIKEPTGWTSHITDVKYAITAFAHVRASYTSPTSAVRVSRYFSSYEQARTTMHDFLRNKDPLFFYEEYNKYNKVEMPHPVTKTETELIIKKQAKDAQIVISE